MLHKFLPYWNVISATAAVLAWLVIPPFFCDRPEIERAERNKRLATERHDTIWSDEEEDRLVQMRRCCGE